MAKPLDRRFGREAFGADPAGYHAARQAYPEAPYQVMRAEAGLAARRGHPGDRRRDGTAPAVARAEVAQLVENRPAITHLASPFFTSTVASWPTPGWK